MDDGITGIRTRTGKILDFQRNGSRKKWPNFFGEELMMRGRSGGMYIRGYEGTRVLNS